MNTGPHGLWYLALLLPALILLGLWYYRRTVPELSPFRRRLLLALRLIGLGALALALARPVFEWERHTAEPAIWLRLVDYSTSMDRQDGLEPGTSRLQSATDIMADPAWSQTGNDVEIRTVWFADSAATDSAGINREGTDLAAALAAAARSTEVPGAVFVVSDGATNAATDPVTQEWPFPVYTVCIGDSGLASDRALVDIDAPAVATAGDSVAVRLRVVSTGDPERAVFTLRAADEVQNRTEQLGGGGRQREMVFTFRPDTAGIYKVTAEVAASTDEVSTANNRIETRVYVEPRQRRALLLALAPDWETSFLVRRLKTMERFDLDVRYRTLTRAGESAPWPFSYDSLAAFDVIILTDMAPVRWVDLAPGCDRYLRERAGGLLLLVGPRAAGGQWSDLQVSLARASFTALPPGVINVSEQVYLSAVGRYHPVAAPKADGVTEVVWTDLPLLTGVIPVLPAGGAVSLVETRASAVSWPVLVAGQMGRGRVLSTFGYPLWRWDFALAATPDKTEWAGPFWSAALRWLASSREGERLTVQPQADPIPALSAPEFGAVLVDESWQPETRAVLTAEIRDSLDELVQTFELRPTAAGRYRGAGRPVLPGDYTYVVRAHQDTVLVAESGGRFSASSVSREAISPASRPTLLGQLSTATGARRLSPTDWSGILDSLPAQPRESVAHMSLRLWESPWLLVLILLVLGLEWILRRRFQML